MRKERPLFSLFLLRSTLRARTFRTASAPLLRARTFRAASVPSLCVRSFRAAPAPSPRARTFRAASATPARIGPAGPCLRQRPPPRRCGASMQQLQPDDTDKDEGQTAQRPAPPVPPVPPAPPAPAKYRIARRRAPAARPRRATASAEHPGQSIGRAAGRHPSRLRDRTHTAHDAAHPDRSLPRSVTRRRTRTAQPPIRSAPSPLPGTKKTTGGRKSVPMVHSRSSVARHNPPSHPPPRGLRSEPVRSTTRSTSGSNRFGGA